METTLSAGYLSAARFLAGRGIGAAKAARPRDRQSPASVSSVRIKSQHRLSGIPDDTAECGTAKEGAEGRHGGSCERADLFGRVSPLEECAEERDLLQGLGEADQVHQRPVGRDRSERQPRPRPERSSKAARKTQQEERSEEQTPDTTPLIA